IDAKIKTNPNLPTLVVFAHPKCPCTRATISELSRIATRCPNQAQINVVFLKPVGSREDWEHTGLWRDAAAIPGVNVMTDVGGAMAAHFNVRTSGATLLYDKSGTRLFQGGITIARGHEGANAGSASIISLLNSDKQCPLTTPVFGCSL